MPVNFSKTYADATRTYQALTAKRAPAGRADVDAVVKACRSTEQQCANVDAALKAAETATGSAAGSAAKSLSVNLKKLNQELRKASSAFAARGAVGGTDAEMKKGFEALMRTLAQLGDDAGKEVAARTAALRQAASR